MNIGIFDSGLGGRFVADKLSQLLPQHNYKVVHDVAHAPYGERSYEDIIQLTEIALAPLLAESDIIVLACNTATVAAIHTLRARYPDKIFVGFEPMIKPASEQTTSGHITLLATHATAHSPRTKELIAMHASGITVDRPSTYGWAAAIDNRQPDSIDLSELKQSIANGSDSIIIGCTHYIALLPRLQELFPASNIFEPSDAVAKQIDRLTHELPQ